MVNGETGVSGLYFYFWEQSFGRITGESSWDNEGGALYFVNTWLWAFMPWVVLSFASLVRTVRNAVLDRALIGEFFTLGGFLIPFLVLSTSNYKLPHYIFVLFPLLAILTAIEIKDHLTRPKKIGHYASLFLYVPLAMLLFFVFPGTLFLILCLTLLSITMMWLGWHFLSTAKRLVYITAIVSVAFNLILNGHFYPNLFSYQSSMASVHYLQEHDIPSHQVTFVNTSPFGLRFFYRSPVNVEFEEKIRSREIQTPWIVTNEDGKKLTLEYYPDAVVKATFPGFKISRLTLNFLNPKTREGTINFAYLVQIKK